MKKILFVFLLFILACQPLSRWESEGIPVNLQSNCESLGGNYCERNQYCDGKALDERCCQGSCREAKQFFIYNDVFLKKNDCFIPKNKCSDGNCKILIIVEDEVKEKLSKELERWKKDIIKDLNFQVEFLTYPSTVIPYQIKSDLAKKAKENIQGIIIVGDIPTMYYGGGFFGEIYPSDYYYIDFEGYCSDEYKKVIKEKPSDTYTPLYVEDKKYFYEGNCQESGQDFQKPFWRGRISPRINKIEKLKKYFDRNHNYRVGELSYDKKLLAYYPIIQSDYGGREEEVDFNLTGLYDEVMIVPLNKDPVVLKNPYGIYEYVVEEVPGETYERLVPSAKKYLEELKKPYEYVFYDGHGWVLNHQPNINTEDIANAKPQAMFYEFNSCSVGRFTVDKYIAGEYLFSGKGLVAFAATTPVLSGPPQFNEYYTINFRNGLIFGEIYNLISHNTAVHVLGDPTLKLRKLKSNARICFNQTSLDFGYSDKGESSPRELKITNIGTEDLIFDFKQKEFPYSTQESLIFNYDCSGTLKPGESKDCFFRANAIKKGNYTGIINFVTNDPENNLVKMIYKGEQG